MSARLRADCLSSLAFPAEGTDREKLWFALHAAALAPSGHNSQPWRFRLRGSRVDLLSDLTRQLPVIDPLNRELTISCGAALFNLQVALQAHGVGYTLAPGKRGELARVSLGGNAPGSPRGHLWDAIPLRHTHRLPFRQAPLVPEHLWALQEAAHCEGCRLIPLSAEVREETIGLIGEVDTRLATDPTYRAALDRWVQSHMRESEAPVLEGVDLVILDDFASTLAPLISRFHRWGLAAAMRDQELARQAPLLAIIAAPGDSERDWLAVGQALERVLLEGVQRGIQASYLNQPLELPDTRKWLSGFTTGWVPHLILRMGYQTVQLGSPTRRPLEELLVD